MDTPQTKMVEDRGQVSPDAAKVYESFFVPALFQEWAPRVARAAQVKAGDQVLDVACGTGVLARYLAQQVQPGGRVTGIDLNAGMLAVARDLAPEIQWDQGEAENLPYGKDSFDAVVCQFGLMFFRDRPQAIREMLRVLRPGGHLAVAVWDTLFNSPGFWLLTELLQARFGDPVADKLRVPFVLGHSEGLLTYFHQAGIRSPHIVTVRGQARFPSLKSWIYTNVRGWAFSDLVSDEQLEALIATAEPALGRFVLPDGTVQFELPAHIVTATKPV